MTSLVPSQGDLYAGGTLHEAGNYPVQSIARWDGTNWTSVGSGIPGVIFALGSDGTNVYAGGRFDSAGGISATNIAKWDGTKWSGLGLGIVPILEGGINVGTVDSLLVDGSNVYVGGRFRRAGNVAATNIARWDGANWHAMGNGLRFFNGSGSENGSVRTLAIVGRQLFAGGEFRLAGNGVSATNVAVWDGTSWSAVESGVNDGFGVLASAASGNDFYAAGAFRRIGGISANRIARWDGNEWNSLGSGIDGQLGDGVSELAASGTELFVAGLFPRAGSKPSKNIALWHIPHSLNISQSSDQVQITWPSTGTNFLLEAKDGLQSTNWSEVPQTPDLHDEQCVVTEPITATNRVYRLRRKPWSVGTVPAWWSPLFQVMIQRWNLSSILPSLRDSMARHVPPTDQSVGYCRASLRDLGISWVPCPNSVVQQEPTEKTEMEIGSGKLFVSNWTLAARFGPIARFDDRAWPARPPLPSLALVHPPL